MTNHPSCFTEVVDTCAAIERLFNAPTENPQACADLLARFSPSYSMITTGGGQLDYDALAAFFKNASGSRQGLKIHIDRLELLHDNQEIVLAIYRETQSLPGCGSTIRFATVLFDKDTKGGLLWRHLHETSGA